VGKDQRQWLERLTTITSLTGSKLSAPFQKSSFLSDATNRVMSRGFQEDGFVARYPKVKSKRNEETKKTCPLLFGVYEAGDRR